MPSSPSYTFRYQKHRNSGVFGILIVGLAKEEPKNMSDKFSSFDRIVSSAIPSEDQSDILDSFRKRFDAGGSQLPEGYEREKTAEELRIVEIANRATNRLREQFGLMDE